MVATTVNNRGASAGPVPPLENGDQLTLKEFLRRYEEMHGIKNAQLIGGIFHSPSPVRADVHAEPDGLIHLWLATYAAGHDLKFYPKGAGGAERLTSC